MALVLSLPKGGMIEAMLMVAVFLLAMWFSLWLLILLPGGMAESRGRRN